MDDSFRLDSHGIYRCQIFDQFSWQSHGFGTRRGNPEVDVTLRQIHSNLVANAYRLQDRAQEGDGLLTDEPKRRIGVRTADCVPILLLDSRQRAVGAIHAGWRGTASEIVRHAVQKLASDFHSAPEDLYAAIGPCIRDCCYQVGLEVARQFVSYFPEWPPLQSSRTVNLAEANRRQMQRAGIPASHIADSGFCTSCQNQQFLSYRREPENANRMVAAIVRLV